MFGIPKSLGRMAIVALCVPATATLPRAGAVPFGWYASGDTSEYHIGTDVARRDGGTGYISATIKSVGDSPISFGLLQQSIRADDFRGRRVRLSGYVRTAPRNEGTGHLWMRVDGERGIESSDYMLARPVVTGTEWTRYDVVLDVSHRAAGITFGVALVGTGQVWLDDVQLEVVRNDVAVTGSAGGLHNSSTGSNPSFATAIGKYRIAPRQPVNLDFEERLIATR